MRLRTYDYAQDGAYFVTICTQHRVCLLGSIVDSMMMPNEIGQMVEYWWCMSAHTFPSIMIDAYIIMPNHIHGIVIIDRHNANDDYHRVGVDPRVHPQRNSTDHNDSQRISNENNVNPHRIPTDTPSLPTILQWFKTMTTNTYIRGVQDYGWTPFVGTLWQRKYYDHVIRNETELSYTRDYINTNPLRWSIHHS